MSRGFACPLNFLAATGRWRAFDWFCGPSEKPDETLPKTLFWHSLIIHSVWRHSSEGLLSRPLAPFVLTSPSDLARSIFCSFPLSFELLLPFPIFPWAFSFCFFAGNIPFYPGPSCSDRRKPPPVFEARLRNRSCLVRGDGLFPASVLTHSLSHAHSPSTFLSLLLLCWLITAFADVLTFPAAQEVYLYPCDINPISLDRSTAMHHTKAEAPVEHLTRFPDL